MKKKSPSPHLYRLKYRLEEPEVGKFTKEEILKDPASGGCDALIMVSILFPEDGSYSQEIFSFDGRNDAKELSGHDLFKFWILMASYIAKHPTTPEGEREMAKVVFEGYKKLILRKDS